MVKNIISTLMFFYCINAFAQIENPQQPTTAGNGLSKSGTALSVIYGTTTNTSLQGSLRGAANGVASLGASGTIPTTQLGVIPVANGGTSNTSLTSNQLIVGRGTSATASISNGAAGTVLTSNGAGADPSFQTPSGMTLVGSFSYSSPTPTINLSNIFSSSFDCYRINVYNVSPSGSGDRLKLRVAVGGSINSSSNYLYRGVEQTTASSFYTSGSDTGYLLMNNNMNPSTSTSFYIDMCDVNSGSGFASILSNTFYIQATGGAFTTVNFGGFFGSAAVISGIALYWASGSNFDSGKVKVYGYSN